jgi:hypothetical protein
MQPNVEITPEAIQKPRFKVLVADTAEQAEEQLNLPENLGYAISNVVLNPTSQFDKFSIFLENDDFRQK